MKEIQTAVQDVPTKIYKIKYTLNVLPGMLEEDDGTLMDTAGQTDELSIFSCKALIDYIEFKWINYAGTIHMVGALFHVLYAAVFSVFVNEIYIYRTFLYREVLFLLMGDSLVYPTVYDFTQLKK
jgi:hypothetical protein